MQILKHFLISNIVLSIIIEVQAWNTREGRGAVYPPFTVIQFSTGLAVPAQVPNRSVFTNFGILNNVPLPSKLSQFYAPKRNERKIPVITLQQFYYKLKIMLHDWNANRNLIYGQTIDDQFLDCVLRSICQISALKNSINKKSDLIFKLLKILFLPSKNKHFSMDRSYMLAEQRGNHSTETDRFEYCTIAYPFCYTSPLELLFKFPNT